MTAKTFIGLIFLIAALLVASVPELLEPTAAGVEKAAVSVGVLPKAKPAAAEAKQPANTGDDTADPRLTLRGFVQEEDGDLRDTVDPIDRESNLRGRLETGTARISLPGQVADPGGSVPPASSEDGVLLDITGCPLFRPDTDVAVLLANPAMQALYSSKVADADDPAACNTLLQERIATATEPLTVPALGSTTTRERAAIRRGGAAAMIIGLNEIELLAQFMDDAEIQEALAALDGSAAADTADTEPDASE